MLKRKDPHLKETDKYLQLHLSFFSFLLAELLLSALLEHLISSPREFHLLINFDTKPLVHFPYHN